MIRPVRGADLLAARLEAAAALLGPLERQPVEASLVFAREVDAGVEAVPIGVGITVGRGSDCTICLPETAGLSRRHFAVRPEFGGWLLEDLASRNGTTVNALDEPVTRRMLRDGDLIFSGDAMFLFVNPG